MRTIKDICAFWDSLHLAHPALSLPLIPRRISSKRLDCIELGKFFHFIAADTKLALDRATLCFLGCDGYGGGTPLDAKEVERQQLYNEENLFSEGMDPLEADVRGRDMSENSERVK